VKGVDNRCGDSARLNHLARGNEARVTAARAYPGKSGRPIILPISARSAKAREARLWEVLTNIGEIAGLSFVLNFGARRAFLFSDRTGNLS
jgi:hypothetical protein